MTLPCIHISLGSWQNDFFKKSLNIFFTICEISMRQRLPLCPNQWWILSLTTDLTDYWQNISLKCLYIFCPVCSMCTNAHTTTNKKPACFQVVAVRWLNPVEAENSPLTLYIKLAYANSSIKWCLLGMEICGRQ